MRDPEIFENTAVTEDDIKSKKKKLRALYETSEEDSLKKLAEDESFWERVSPENVEFLLKKEEEIQNLQNEVDNHKKKCEMNKKIGEIAINNEQRMGIFEKNGTPDKEDELDMRLIETGKEIILNSPQTYISIDIEADGIAGYGSMLSIGAVSPNGEEFYSEIRPISEDYIDANRNFAEEHGLERKRLEKSAPDSLTVMQKFSDWIESVVERNENKKPVFVAFNAAFDWSFVDLYFKKSGIDNPFGIAPLDLKSIALSLKSNSDFDWIKTKKDNLPNSILPNENFTHNALDDAIYQQTLFYGLVALNQKQNEKFQ